MVWSSTLTKYGKDWDQQISLTEDIQGFYDNPQNMLSKYHIYLKPYENIIRLGGILAIKEENCSPYNVAKMSMSKTLFIYLDKNKERSFEKYREPINFIEAYRPSLGGISFLQHILKKWHPNLKDCTERKSNRAPTYNQYRTIQEFINACIEWINDEALNGQVYSHKEKPDNILECLDKERWEAVIKNNKYIG
jgi:hypothetical protein